MLIRSVGSYHLSDSLLYTLLHNPVASQYEYQTILQTDSKRQSYSIKWGCTILKQNPVPGNLTAKQYLSFLHPVQDSFSPRQSYTQTILHPDNLTPRQSYTQTILHPDNLTPRQSYPETLVHPDNRTPRQSISKKCQTISTN